MVIGRVKYIAVRSLFSQNGRFFGLGWSFLVEFRTGDGRVFALSVFKEADGRFFTFDRERGLLEKAVTGDGPFFDGTTNFDNFGRFFTISVFEEAVGLALGRERNLLGEAETGNGRFFDGTTNFDKREITCLSVLWVLTRLAGLKRLIE